MAKKHNSEKEWIFATSLSNGRFTIAQLYNHHTTSPRSLQEAPTIFNLVYKNLEAVKSVFDNIELKDLLPSTNSKLKQRLKKEK